MSIDPPPLSLTYGCDQDKISLEDALLLARKWQEEEHPLKLSIFAPELYVSFHVIIGNIQEDNLFFQPMAASQLLGDAMVGLNECSLHYSDSREAPPSSVEGKIYDSILTIIRPDDSYVLVTEYRILSPYDLAELRNAREIHPPSIE
jgi:hypothetical protein